MIFSAVPAPPLFASGKALAVYEDMIYERRNKKYMGKNEGGGMSRKRTHKHPQVLYILETFWWTRISA